MRLIYDYPPDTTDFYLADGIRLDGYQTDGPKNMNNKKMFLHSEGIDLDLNGIPDCTGGDPDSCESYIVEAWNEGYEAFLDSVRIYTARIRGADSAFIILTNGHPSDPEQRQYLNGRFFEDANGEFHENNLYQVVNRSRGYEDDPNMVDPKEILYFERDRDFPDSIATNLAQMRLTLAITLFATDIGRYGTIGEGDQTRSPIFSDVFIEDFYDEYAVDSLGRGYQHAELPHDDEAYLLGAKYYLGMPLDTAKVYVHQGVSHEDMRYREFDHGVVIAHLGLETGCEYQIPQIWISDLELEEPPDSTCHLMRIEGSDDPMYNDGKNTGEHPVVYVWYVDSPGDDDVYGRGDALILLKEGDGFFVHEGCECP
jgi:hypothetical protein